MQRGIEDPMDGGTVFGAAQDVYLPYRPKRRTRATIAREKGLEPLALLIWRQIDFEVQVAASEYINFESGVEGVEDALDGARDIIAEWVSF